MVAISYDSVPVLTDFAKRRGITFPLLSDAGSAVIKEYGLLNTSVQPTNALQYGIPLPGTIIVNRSGIVTSRVFEEAYQERDTISSVLVRLGHRIGAVATKITAPNLDITTYSTDAAVSTGTHFSLVLDITPGRRVHVYAPGVVDYRPIALTVKPQPGVLVRDTHFPPSEIYHFKPLDERVPVFQKPFRVVQDIVIDPSQQGVAALAGTSALTLTGTLDYQACDDAVCYLPQSVPLSWTVAVKPLDRDRAVR